ncbi:MAG: hypothetical protein EOM80_19430 [Erysipelotrichia bacterium]|nr:hypothetical protein [Erysipelotrichia bacterium]
MRGIEKILEFKGMVILREFDHGASADFWLVPMSGEELEKWWSSQETFNDNPPQQQETAQFLAEFFNETLEPKKAWCLEWPGEIIPAETDEERQLWLTLYETENHYFCHYYGDSDSYLISPSGKRIHHKGFAPEA